MSLLSGNSPRRKKRGGSRALPPAVSGPWQGVHILRGTPGIYQSGRLLYSMQNMYIPDVARGSACVSRPGVTRIGTIQLGSGASRRGQCVFEHVRADGTIDRIFFAGGKMYRWDGTTTVTDITPAATTISTTARIFCCAFNDKIIVSDGVNTPWAYNPVTATRALIDIDGSATAWVARGVPFVYAAKLFFINASKGATSYTSRLIWSEEADETIGYVQTGAGTTYTNKWDISQTNPNPLTAAVPTNSGIYYFRTDSIGFISGQVNAAFATTATHDAISTTVGTVSPDAVVLVGEDIYFLDRYMRQWRLRGGTLEPLWEANFDSGNALEPVASTSSIYYPRLNLILTDVLTAHTGTRLVWDVATGAFFDTWNMPIAAIHAMGVVRDAAGPTPFMIMIGEDYDGSEGCVYRFRLSGEGGTFDDSLWVSGTLHRRTISVLLGDDLEHHQRFTKVVAEVYNSNALASTTYLLSEYGVGGLDATATSTSIADATADRVTWGTNIFGRRLKVTISCDDRGNLEPRYARMLVDRIDAGYNPDGP